MTSAIVDIVLGNLDNTPAATRSRTKRLKPDLVIRQSSPARNPRG